MKAHYSLLSLFVLSGCSAMQGTAQSNDRYSNQNVVIQTAKEIPATSSDEESPELVAKKDILKGTSAGPYPGSEQVKPAQAASPVPPPETESAVAEAKAKAPAKTSEPSWFDKLLAHFTPEKVKPWQKSVLARPSMKPGGLVSDSEKFNEKVHSSKESSRGGNGVAGGGCGCN